MNLRKIYFSIIRRAKENPNIGEMYDVYCEEHHILPVSIYGQNKKTVILTGREHLVVHHILWRWYKKVWGEKHSRTIKMCAAYKMMICDSLRYGQIKKINSREYQKLKEAHAKNMSLRMTGENNSMFGVPSFWTGKKRPDHSKLMQRKMKNGEIKWENNIHPFETEKFKLKMLGANNPSCRPEVKIKQIESKAHKMRAVERIDIKTGEVKEYRSQKDAFRDGFHQGHISECCIKNTKYFNKRFISKGYYWQFLDEIDNA